MTTRSGDDVLELALDVSAVPKRPAGAGRYVVELARALAGRGDCSLALVARRDDAARWEEIAPRQRVLAVAPSRRATRLLYEQVRLASVVAALGSPAVEVHHGPHYSMPRRSRVPCVVTVHDMTFFDHPEWHERSKVTWFRSAIRYSAGHAALIVCVSEATAGRLRDILSPSCPVVVVPHGVDHARFAPDEPSPGADREVLRRLGLPRPYALHLGTLEPRKGIVDLVAAFDLLAESQPELELVLAGGVGWKAEPALQAIAAAGASGRIRRLGYVPDEHVPALLRGARAVVYPSLEEGFGLPALEALACGAPLVTTAGTAMAELAGGSALLVPAGSPPALAAAMETAIALEPSGDGARRRERGLAIAAPYTWESCAEGHLAAYRAAAGA
jgi:glycosyltransferase involved in cell wall biosynthesis